MATVEDENYFGGISQADKAYCQNISFGGTQNFIQTELMPPFRELTKLIAHQIGKRCRYYCLLL
jgi:hypothetical protein